MPPDVALTIVEEKGLGRMRWDYVFGKPGHKGYKRVTKYVTMSPKDCSMITYWEGEDRRTFDVPELAAFARTGFGMLVASTTALRSTFFHGGKVALDRMTLKLQPDSLSYVWDETIDGRRKPYSDFELTRVP